jgi:amino acid adenylation domain-containing protein
MLASESLPAPTPSRSSVLEERALVQLPTDAVRTSSTVYERGACEVTQSAIVAAFSGPERQATISAALCVLLHRYTQQEQLAIDVIVAGPTGSRWSLVDLPVSAEQSLRSLSTQLTRALTHGSEHAPREARAASIAITFDERPAERSAEGEGDATSYDVHLFAPRNATTPWRAVYNANLFNETSIVRLIGSLDLLIVSGLANPECALSSFEVVSEADAHTIRTTWDSGSAQYEGLPAHRLFEQLARTQPEAVAGRFGEQAATYQELDARSNRLARHLLERGVVERSRVALCVTPSLDVLVGILAIFKVGATYVPLDPTHPEALIATILDEAEPKLVLTQANLRALTNPERFAQFCFDIDEAKLATLPSDAPDVAVSLSHPAYLLYTSGTTGKPKGVVATHENLAHYLHVAREKYGFSHNDRFCSLARYTFSISMFELLSPLTCGGSVRLLVRDDVLAPDKLAKTIEEITVIHAGPSLLGSLFRYLGNEPSQRRSFSHVRHASSGGDLVSPSVMEDMKRVFDQAELFVIYGCTEISCMGCTFPIERDRKVTRSFVGKAFPDVTARVFDPYGRFTPLGAVGEICFAGKGVVSGYLQREELTSERFVMRDGQRFYLTGDMGRLHEDGNIEILGRRDYQVQLRGIRVELPGIENTVRDIGLASQCAVAVKKLDDNDVRLVAFVVKPTETTTAAFRRKLAQHLPDYMLPQSMVALDALPLTRNGKLDRARLQELPWRLESDHESKTAPRNPVEQQIAQAFVSTLGIQEVGIDDDFFDLGGHSLLAVALIQELENVLGLTLSPGLLFEHTTVRTLAHHTRGELATEPKPIPLGTTTHHPPLFMLLGVHLYRGLAKLLDDQYSVYGVYAGSELLMFESTENTASVAELAREYVAIIRRAQPSGPYRLAGMSFGGIVAYEVAQQLQDAGEHVAFLGIIDGILPERGLRERLTKLARLTKLPPRRALKLLLARGQRVLDRLRGMETPSEFAQYAGMGQLGVLEERREAAYFRAAAAYAKHVRPFEGQAALVVAGKRLANDPLESASCGWARHIPRLDVLVLDSEHLALLERPMVERLAEAFARVLSRESSVAGR